MKGLRGKRLSSEYQKAVSEIIGTTLRDRTDFAGAIVSVTKADVSADLKNAKIYLSVYAGDPAKEKRVFGNISENAGFIRHELSRMMRSRTVPELHFYQDDSMEYGDRIDRVLSDLHAEEGSRTENDAD